MEKEDNDLNKTPARLFDIDREKGIISVSKKAFEDFGKTPLGQKQSWLMTELEIRHFDYWMYDKTLHKKMKVETINDMIKYLQHKADIAFKFEADSVYGHLCQAKIMEIKYSFRSKLFWHNVKLKLKSIWNKKK